MSDFTEKQKVDAVSAILDIAGTEDPRDACALATETFVTILSATLAAMPLKEGTTVGDFLTIYTTKIEEQVGRNIRLVEEAKKNGWV